MKIEINTPGHNKGAGTIVTIDGEQLRRVCGIKLMIPIDGFPVIEIEQLSQNEEGQFLLEFDENGDRVIATKTLRIRGSVTFEGEAPEGGAALALAHAGC